jgi:hypothetical protein
MHSIKEIARNLFTRIGRGEAFDTESPGSRASSVPKCFALTKVNSFSEIAQADGFLKV